MVELRLPWHASKHELVDEHGCKLYLIEDNHGWIVGSTAWMNNVPYDSDDGKGDANEQYRDIIIRSVNNLPKLMDALKLVVYAYQDSGVESDGLVAFAMKHEDMQKLISAYTEACHDTEASQS